MDDKENGDLDGGMMTPQVRVRLEAFKKAAKPGFTPNGLETMHQMMKGSIELDPTKISKGDFSEFSPNSRFRPPEGALDFPVSQSFHPVPKLTRWEQLKDTFVSRFRKPK